jgi:hypothetical protein
MSAIPATAAIIRLNLDMETLSITSEVSRRLRLPGIAMLAEQLLSHRGSGD